MTYITEEIAEAQDVVQNVLDEHAVPTCAHTAPADDELCIPYDKIPTIMDQLITELVQRGAVIPEGFKA